jgi:hypothetical protein
MISWQPYKKKESRLVSKIVYFKSISAIREIMYCGITDAKRKLGLQTANPQLQKIVYPQIVYPQ